MGKRSNFKRMPRDLYLTPPEAIAPLLPHLGAKVHFCEPCAGDGRMRDYLISQGHTCDVAIDIKPLGPAIMHEDALRVLVTDIDCFITNPPWSRPILHALIDHLSRQHVTWLLIDADWMQTQQAAPYLRRCSTIVPIGRVKWFADSKFSGKDNCCWYRFSPTHRRGPRFIPFS